MGVKTPPQRQNFRACERCGHDRNLLTGVLQSRGFAENARVEPQVRESDHTNVHGWGYRAGISGGGKTKKSSSSFEDELLYWENQECGNRVVCDRELQARPSNEALWGGITLKIPIPGKGHPSPAALPVRKSHSQQITTLKTIIHLFVCAGNVQFPVVHNKCKAEFTHLIVYCQVEFRTEAH